MSRCRHVLRRRLRPANSEAAVPSASPRTRWSPKTRTTLSACSGKPHRVSACADYNRFTFVVTHHTGVITRLMLVSNSTLHGSGYLDHCAAEMVSFLGPSVRRVLFVPYALFDRDA